MSEWKEFERKIIPHGAPRLQIVEMRRAWYAGAAALFSMMTLDIDEGTEPTELDLEFVDNIANEITEFAKQLGRGEV